MPWADIALQVRGDCVIDMLRHFVQYWHYVREATEMGPAKLLDNLKNRVGEAVDH